MVLKADVQGSLQPIIEGLEELKPKRDEDISVNILYSGIGPVSENDVHLASTAGAVVIAFNVGVDNVAEKAAISLGVDIRKYNVIYKLFESIELALSGMLEPEYVTRTIGRVEVRQVFRISRVGAVAGSYVLDGEIRRNATARVLRGNDVIVEGEKVSSLKREADDVREVRAGFECGVSLASFNDFEEGDIIEFQITERVN